MSDLSRRNLIIGAGLAAAVAVPAGIYGVPRFQQMLARGPKDGGDKPAKPLDENQMALVSAMAEGVIPKTDTAGAIEAGVPAFIGTIYSDWFQPDEQAGFRDGLKSFEEATKARFGRKFADCTSAQKLALLTDWDQAVVAARARGATKLPPFAQFKSLTVIGYYTSQAGQEGELHTEMDAGQMTANGPVMMPVPFNL